MKIGMISLGCPKNLVDSEFMLGCLTAAGHILTNDPSEAEVIIVNTCGFIDSAKEESILTVLQMAEYKKAGKCNMLLLAGCLAQRFAESVQEELPEIDGIIGTGSWTRIAEAIDEVCKGNKPVFLEGQSILPDNEMPRVRTSADFFAYVKIAEGCNHACSFCSIPLIRGPLVSRTIESISAEVLSLIKNGIKEIILVAQDSTSYGIDLYGKPKLCELLRELSKIQGEFWIRILYSYPHHFSDELIELMASEDKICKYVDIPIQHIDDSMLKKMRRPDTRKGIETLIEKLRNRIQDVAIRSSLIVGLPGETEQQFNELLNFVENARFDHLGIFVYSAEEGTEAEKMDNQISDAIKEERFDALMAAQAAISEEINRDAEGNDYTALIEEEEAGPSSAAVARTFREAPDIDGKVYIEDAEGLKPGHFVSIRIVQGYCYDRIARPIAIESIEFM